MLFDKKKEKDMTAGTDMNSIEKYISSVVVDIKADIDRLKAHSEAEKEIRSSVQERFSHVNETMGQLREMLIESEKKYQTLEEKSTKSIDLMNELEPEKINSMIQAQDFKVQKQDAKSLANASMIKNLIDELKSLKSSFSRFKGVEKIIETADDIKREVSTFNKIKSNTERQAEKVGNIFVEVERNFNDFKKYQQKQKDLEKDFREVLKDFDVIKIDNEKNKNISGSLEDIQKRSKLYEEKIDTFVFSLEKIKEEGKKSNQILLEQIGAIEEIKEKYIKKVDEEDNFVNEKIKEFEKAKERYESKFNAKLFLLEDILEQRAKKMDALDKNISINVSKETQLLSKIKSLEKANKGIQKSMDEKLKKTIKGEQNRLNTQLNREVSKIIKEIEEKTAKAAKNQDVGISAQFKEEFTDMKNKIEEVHDNLTTKSEEIRELDKRIGIDSLSEARLTDKIKHLESLDAKFLSKEDIQKANIELQKAIDEKINKTIEEKQALLNAQINQDISAKVDNIRKEIKENTCSFISVQDKITGLQSTINNKTQEINKLDKKIGSFELLQNKITHIENTIDNKFSKMNELDKDVIKNADRQTKLMDKIISFEDSKNKFVSKKDLRKFNVDIIKEIEEKTAKAAKSHKLYLSTQFKEEFTGMENKIEEFQDKLITKSEEIRELNKRIGINSSKEAHLTDKIKQMEAEETTFLSKEDIRKANIEMQKALNEKLNKIMQDAGINTDAKLEELSKNIVSNSGKEKDLMNELKTLEVVAGNFIQRQDLQKSNSDIQKTLNEKITKLMQDAGINTDAKLSKVNKKLKAVNLVKNKILNIQDTLNRRAERLDELNKDIEINSSKEAILMKRINSLESANKELQKTMDEKINKTIEEEHAKLNSQLSSEVSKINKIKKDIKENTNSFIFTKDKVEELQNTINSKTGEFSKLDKKLKLFDSAIEEKISKIDDTLKDRTEKIDLLNKGVDINAMAEAQLTDKLKQIEAEETHFLSKEDIRKANINMQKALNEKLTKIMQDAGINVDSKFNELNKNIVLNSRKEKKLMNELKTLEETAANFIDKEDLRKSNLDTQKALNEKLTKLMQDSGINTDAKFSKVDKKLKSMDSVKNKISDIQSTLNDRAKRMDELNKDIGLNASKETKLMNRIQSLEAENQKLQKINPEFQKTMDERLNKIAESGTLLDAKVGRQLANMESNITRGMNENIKSVSLMSLNMMKDKINELENTIDKKTRNYIEEKGNTIVE